MKITTTGRGLWWLGESYKKLVSMLAFLFYKKLYILVLRKLLSTFKITIELHQLSLRLEVRDDEKSKILQCNKTSLDMSMYSIRLLRCFVCA